MWWDERRDRPGYRQQPGLPDWQNESPTARCLPPRPHPRTRSTGEAIAEALGGGRGGGAGGRVLASPEEEGSNRLLNGSPRPAPSPRDESEDRPGGNVPAGGDDDVRPSPVDPPRQPSSSSSSTSPAAARNHSTGSTSAMDDPNAEDAQDFDAAAEELPRPIGRDKAKKKRRNESGQSSESSACLELFQQMARERELKNQLQASVASELKEMHERTLALEEERLRQQLELQQEHNRKLLELQQEKFRWKQRQWEAEQVEKDNRIMMMDLSSVSGVARDYFLRMQREIIQRRWGGDGNNNDVN